MISFELSFVDIVLAMAIIILILLQMRETPEKHTAEPELSHKNRKEEIPRKVKKRKEEDLKRIKKKKESSLVTSPEGSLKCPHHFGYLKTLPLGSSAPEECYSCSRMMQCLFFNDQDS